MTGRHSRALEPFRKRRKRVTTHNDYAKMADRIALGQAKRAGASLEAVVGAHQLEDAARDYANLAIYMAHYRAEDPDSLNTIGQALGMTKQAVAKRVNLGREVADQLAAEGRLTVSQ